MRHLISGDIYHLLMYLFRTEWRFLLFLFIYCTTLNHIEAAQWIAKYLEVPVYSIGALWGDWYSFGFSF